MKITIQHKDLGFFTQQAITVQRFLPADGDYERELVYCDHAGAREETDHVTHASYDGHDIEYDVDLLVCNKCTAWKIVGESWQDAPSEGVYND